MKFYFTTLDTTRLIACIKLAKHTTYITAYGASPSVRLTHQLKYKSLTITG